MNIRGFIAASMLCLVTVGCSTSAGTGPPSVRYGEETCAHCRMIISDDRFAAALVDREGETLKFDDVGCLVIHELEAHPSLAKRWVRDFGQTGWLDGGEATFVHSRAIATPMGYHLAAVATPELAATLGRDPGARRLRYPELAGLVRRQGNPETGAAAGPDLPHISETSSTQELIR